MKFGTHPLATSTADYAAGGEAVEVLH